MPVVRSLAVAAASLAVLAACATPRGGPLPASSGRYVHADLGWSVDLPPGRWRAEVQPDGGVRFRNPDVAGEIAVDLMPGLDVAEARFRLRRGARRAESLGVAYPTGRPAEMWRFDLPGGGEVATLLVDPAGRGTWVIRRDAAGGAALDEAYDLVVRRFRLGEPPRR